MLAAPLLHTDKQGILTNRAHPNSTAQRRSEDLPKHRGKGYKEGGKFYHHFRTHMHFEIGNSVVSNNIIFNNIKALDFRMN